MGWIQLEARQLWSRRHCDELQWHLEYHVFIVCKALHWKGRLHTTK